MQRLGRKGHPTYRVVVQDSRLSPTSGKYVALLGSYDPHTKQSSLAKDRAKFYLEHGAQPSDRVVRLFKAEKIALPKWVKEPTKQERKVRNPEKLRRNRPAEEAETSSPAEPTEETKGEEVAENKPANDEPVSEAPTEVKEADDSDKVDEAVDKSGQEAEEKPADNPEAESKQPEEEKKSDKKEETSK